LAICWFLPTEEWKHINWGYASLTKSGHSIPDLNYADEDKRTYYQLYHYLATGLGNWNTLEGKNVLELRSGGGGGINYVAQKLNPDNCIGVDISSTQSKFCQKAYSKIPKLSFYTAVCMIFWMNLISDRILLMLLQEFQNWLIKE